MTQQGIQGVTTISDRIGQAVRHARLMHGWSQAQLAARCAELGAPQLTRIVITDIETGRRDADGKRRRAVDADEWVILALALDVALIHLAVPLTEDEDTQLAPAVSAPSGEVRLWARGQRPLPGVTGDRRIFYAFVPEREAARAEELGRLAAMSGPAAEVLDKIISEGMGG